MVPSFLIAVTATRAFHWQMGGRGDNVFAGGPVAKVDSAAAVAAKRSIGVGQLDRFLTNRAAHQTIWMSWAA